MFLRCQKPHMAFKPYFIEQEKTIISYPSSAKKNFEKEQPVKVCMQAC